jgi:hypothetical protein
LFERTIVRKIIGLTYENGYWRIKTKKELDKIIRYRNVINIARAQSVGRFGHVERMQETRMIKAVHCWKPISKRPTGRPKTRWEVDVKKYIRKVKVPNWKTIVQDRRRWKELVTKAKTLH